MPRSSSGLAAVLAALTAIGPFTIDAYLPAFPAIAQSLGASAFQVQQTLTAFMVPFALMALWHGALSDRFGRRPVILVSLGLFGLASLVCALAPSIEWLWFGRVLQGMSSGAGMIVGRAVIRDLHSGAEAQRLMSRVMLIFSAAPAVAPVLGGWLLELAGWRSIFFFLVGFSGFLLYLIRHRLPETLPPEQRQPLHPGELLRGYRAVLGSAAFLLLVAASGFNFNGFFLYVMSAPVFIIEHLRLGATEFGWLFVPGVAGMMLGSLCSARVAGRWSERRSLVAAYTLMFLSGSLAVLNALQAAPGLWGSVLPVGLYTAGMALAMPVLTLRALDLFPQRRGMAASCQSFVQFTLNALCAGLAAPLLWPSLLTLALGSVGFALLGLLCWQAGLRWLAR